MHLGKYDNCHMYLYDSSKVCRGEGWWVIINVRDVYIDHHSRGHGWDSTIHSTDDQRVAGDLEEHTEKTKQQEIMNIVLVRVSRGDMLNAVV